MPDDLKGKGLAEVLRILRPGGRILVVDIDALSDDSPLQRLGDLIILAHGGCASSRNRMERLVSLLENTGFSEINVQRINRQASSIAGRKS